MRPVLSCEIMYSGKEGPNLFNGEKALPQGSQQLRDPRRRPRSLRPGAREETQEAEPRDPVYACKRRPAAKGLIVAVMVACTARGVGQVCGTDEATEQRGLESPGGGCGGRTPGQGEHAAVGRGPGSIPEVHVELSVVCARNGDTGYEAFTPFPERLFLS